MNDIIYEFASNLKYTLDTLYIRRSSVVSLFEANNCPINEYYKPAKFSEGSFLSDKVIRYNEKQYSSCHNRFACMLGQLLDVCPDGIIYDARTDKLINTNVDPIIGDHIMVR